MFSTDIKNLFLVYLNDPAVKQELYVLNALGIINDNTARISSNLTALRTVSMYDFIMPMSEPFAKMMRERCTELGYSHIDLSSTWIHFTNWLHRHYYHQNYILKTPFGEIIDRINDTEQDVLTYAFTNFLPPFQGKAFDPVGAFIQRSPKLALALHSIYDDSEANYNEDKPVKLFRTHNAIKIMVDKSDNGNYHFEYLLHYGWFGITSYSVVFDCKGEKTQCFSITPPKLSLDTTRVIYSEEEFRTAPDEIHHQSDLISLISGTRAARSLNHEYFPGSPSYGIEDWFEFIDGCVIPANNGTISLEAIATKRQDRIYKGVIDRLTSQFKKLSFEDLKAFLEINALGERTCSSRRSINGIELNYFASMLRKAAQEQLGENSTFQPIQEYYLSHVSVMLTMSETTCDLTIVSPVFERISLTIDISDGEFQSVQRAESVQDNNDICLEMSLYHQKFQKVFERIFSEHNRDENTEALVAKTADSYLDFLRAEAFIINVAMKYALDFFFEALPS